MKKIRLFVLFLVMVRGVQSQVALSYYPLSSYVGISTNPYKRVWADFRMLTNTFMSNSNMELYPMINIKNDSIVRCYAGVGINFNLIYGLYDNGRYINGYLITLGTRVSPFPKARNLGFIAEFSPYLNAQFSGATLRTNLGISWRFKKKWTG